MKVFALADLHLGLAVDKPMDVFGDVWRHHTETIAARWSAVVGPDDAVIVAGDVSWGLSFDEALADLSFLGRLPGTVWLLRGNHDYWWSTVAKMTRRLHADAITSIRFVRYTAERIAPHVVVAGSRGWVVPSEANDQATARPIYERECARFDLALADLKRIRRPDDGAIALSHYPPYTKAIGSTPVTDRIRDAAVDLCLHGHLHHPPRLVHTVDGVPYLNTVCNRLAFTPLLIHDGERFVWRSSLAARRRSTP